MSLAMADFPDKSDLEVNQANVTHFPNAMIERKKKQEGK